MKLFIQTLGLLSVFFCASAELIQIQLPTETGVYKPTAGADLANAQCLTCHSTEYVSTQPPMPRAFWKASVEKMRSKYGAPIAEDQIEALTDYLTINYGTGMADATVAETTEKTAPQPVEARMLLQKNGCFNCHAVDKKQVGPSFAEIAAKYKDNKEAGEKISHQITEGGSGLWGSIPMPPFKQFSAEEIKSIGTWVLQQ